MTFDVVTTYAEKHWAEYASRCVSSFDEFWAGVPLYRCTDDTLNVRSTWLQDFKQRHKDKPTHNYRFDAVRFAHKVAAIELAYKDHLSDVLIWMDADCVTHSKVDDQWLSSLIGDADFAYLRRSHKYSETGFMMFRRNHRTDQLIAMLIALYRTDKLFDLKEWHDCEAIDTVRRFLESRGAIKCVSLSGAAENTGHPLVNGPLGERLDHLKGKRKQVGKSLRSDLKTQRTEAYWNGR